MLQSRMEVQQKEDASAKTFHDNFVDDLFSLWWFTAAKRNPLTS